MAEMLGCCPEEIIGKMMYDFMDEEGRALADKRLELRRQGIKSDFEFKAIRNSLFLPFSQLEYTLSRKRDGAGLGLAISKNLVELMGGKIWAESSPGIGSKFSFTIEAEAALGLPARSEIKAQSVENLAEQHPLRILVAEDNLSNQRVVVEMLKNGIQGRRRG